jgi:hypothetical protein
MRVHLGSLGQTYSQAQIVQMIVAAAQANNVPVNIALGVAAHESGFNPNATNVNTNGTTDYGVMQLNTTTVQTLGVANPMDPQQNINAGVGLLGKYLAQYDGNTDLALQAYASGAGTVASGAAPNATATQFISYVEGYNPAPVLTAAGIDASSGVSVGTDPGTGTDTAADDSVDNGIFDSGDDAIFGLDPTFFTVAVAGLAVAGWIWMQQSD